MEDSSSPGKRLINFSAGPCQLPLEVLEDVQREIVNFRGWGLSVMEMSHRGPHFRAVLAEGQCAASKFLRLPATHSLFFMAGGATAQFAAEPLNLLRSESLHASYAVTGYWSKFALTEAQKFGRTEVATDAAKLGFREIGRLNSWSLSPQAAYLHYCDNETIHGLEYPEGFFESHLLPEKCLMTADMASNMGTRPLRWGAIDLAYAGGQKNIGIAGVTLVAIKRTILEGKESPARCPVVLDYRRTLAAESCLNTPPTFNIYVMGKMFTHLARVGDLEYWDRLCKSKSGAVYDQCDDSDGFYSAPVTPPFRSRVTVRFDIQANQHVVSAEAAEKHEIEEFEGEKRRQCDDGSGAPGPQKVTTANGAVASMQKAKEKDKALTDLFVKQAEKSGLICLNGHRSLGGLRASLYSGVSTQHVEELTTFMRDFQEEHSVV